MKLPEPKRNDSTDPAKAWVVRASAPRRGNGRRSQPRIYGRTKRECTENLIEFLGDVNAGRNVGDRRMTVSEHFDRRLRWWESEDQLKSLDSYREAIELYLRPACGHLRIVDMSQNLGRDVAVALRKINRPDADEDSTDLLRRLLAARAVRDGKRISTRPLSESRITRILAVGSSACADLVPGVLAVNPFAKVKSGKGRRLKPLLWTGPRVERWQETGQVPSSVMVWDQHHCGAFLDSITAERLYSLFDLAAYSGLRRSELCGLCWAEVDLDNRRIHIRQAQVDDELDSTKSEDSDRIIKISQQCAAVLRAWRQAQRLERMKWGAAWSDTGRVFTREDGTALRPQWVSARFAALARKASLPPIRFHDLRHGAATMLLAAGTPMKVVSEMLGHATVAFTADVYTSVMEELMDTAAEGLTAFVPRKIISGGASDVPVGGGNDA